MKIRVTAEMDIETDNKPLIDEIIEEVNQSFAELKGGYKAVKQCKVTKKVLR